MYSLLLLVFFQDLKLPAEIRGEPNQFITIIADTPGEIVRFVSVDPGLSIFPADLLANKKATVVTGPAGRYRIIAYTAISGKPSDPSTITVIIGNTPNPGPNPGPQPPTPPKPDPLAGLSQTLASIYGGLQEVGRETQTKTLAGIYRQGAADLARHNTVADVYNGLQAQSAVKMQPQSIVEIRRAIASDMQQRFGNKGDTVLTDDLRKALSDHFLNLSSILEGLI
jgi:hypothetical protein